MGHVGLRNAQNTSGLTLFRFFLFQDFENVKILFANEPELVGIFQTKIGKNVSRLNLDFS